MGEEVKIEEFWRMVQSRCCGNCIKCCRRRLPYDGASNTTYDAAASLAYTFAQEIRFTGAVGDT